MTTHFTDAEILEAWSKSGPPIIDETTMMARFRAFLSALRQSTQSAQPILADDGLSLGQVAYEAMMRYQFKGTGLRAPTWEKAESYVRNKHIAMAHDVFAAARPAIEAEALAQAVRRMEAVPLIELNRAWHQSDERGVRARLIAAVKGEGYVESGSNVAVGRDGAVYHNPEKTYALAEEAECVRMWLDSVNAPTQDAMGKAYSLVGRIQAWADKDKGEAALSAIDDEGNPATTSDEPSDPYHAEEVPQAKPEPAWIPHDGGSCPLKDEEVEEWEYKLLDGSIYKYSPPSERSWKHLDCFADIIAYRVLKWKPGFGPEAKAEAATFESHGYTWTRHTPGDPMPCDGDKDVEIVRGDGGMPGFRCGFDWNWAKLANPSNEVIGWRYADEHPKDMLLKEGIIAQVLCEVTSACDKFPTWPTDPLHALAVMGEEFGELTKEMLQLTYEPHKTSPERVREEAVQTAAMAFRLLRSLGHYEYLASPQHSQTTAKGEGQTKPIVVNEPPQEERQADLSGESERQDLPATLNASTLPATARLSLSRAVPTEPWTPAVGDTVRLKSGGPEMTVVGGLSATEAFPCEWFNEINNGRHRGSFPAACLTPAMTAAETNMPSNEHHESEFEAFERGEGVEA